MVNHTDPQPGPLPPGNRRAWLLDPHQLTTGLTAGVARGPADISVLLSLAALIFAGPLAGFVANGIGLALIGTGVMNIVYALLSARPAMVIYAQEGPALVVALLAGAIATSLSGTATSDALYATVVAAIAVTTFATGLTFVLLGQFRLGSLVRYFPYSVIGGFLAGTGWLLLLGGIGVITGGTG